MSFKEQALQLLGLLKQKYCVDGCPGTQPKCFMSNPDGCGLHLALVVKENGEILFETPDDESRQVTEEELVFAEPQEPILIRVGSEKLPAAPQQIREVTTKYLPPLMSKDKIAGKFNVLATCPKCGLSNEAKYSKAISTRYDKVNNSMVRTCTRCFYDWREDPLDTTPCL